MKTNLKFAVGVLVMLLLPGVCMAQAELGVRLSSMYERFIEQGDERVFLQTDRDKYALGDTILVRAFLFPEPTVEKRYIESRFVYVDLINSAGVVVNREKILHDTISNSFIGYVRMYDNVEPGEYELQAYTYWMQNKGVDAFFKKRIYISGPENSELVSGSVDNMTSEFGVVFTPEGGSLIAGHVQKVAFAANNSAIEWSGWVVKDAEKRVVDLKPDEYGYGSFSFTPEAGSSYFAVIKLSYGEMRFPLPKVVSEGAFSFNMTEGENGGMRYKVLHTPDVTIDGKFILAYTNFDFLGFIQAKEEGIIELDSTVSDGIVNFALLDEQGKIYADRSWYYINNKCAVADLTLTESVDNKSDLTLTLDPSDEIEGVDVAVSVVPLENLNEASLNNGIYSYMNFTSHFDYPIENPGYYLSDQERLNDLLILKRCKFGDLVEMESLLEKYQSTIFSKEYDMILEGYVVNRKGKPVTSSVIKRKGEWIQSGRVYLEGEDEMIYFLYPDRTGYFKRGEIFWDNEMRFFSEYGYHMGLKTIHLMLLLPEYLNEFDYSYLDAQNLKPTVGKKSVEWTDNKARYKITKPIGRVMMPPIGGSSGALTGGYPFVWSSLPPSLAGGTMNLPEQFEPAIRSYIKVEIKPSMRRLTHFAPQRRRHVGYDAEKTYNWSWMAKIDKDNPYKITLPSGVQSKGYAVIVNGVDNSGNPIQKIWKIVKN